MAEYGLKHSLTVSIKRAERAEKFAILLLLFILLTAATAGVSAVLTGPDWASLWKSLLLGMLFGWVLAIFRWPAWRSALLVIGLGLLFSALFAGGLSEKVTAVFEELLRLAGGIISSLTTKEADFSLLTRLIQQVFTSTGVVLGRVFSWLKDLVIGQPIFDPVAAGFVWSIVVWLVAGWAGWVVEARRNALIAVLPALILNLSTLSYGQSNSITVYLILGLTLVLIALVQYDQREQEWDETKIAYPIRKGRQIGNTSLVIAIMLVFLSAFLSSLSINRIEKWATELNRPSSQQESGLAKSLGIQQVAAPPDAFSTVRSPGLPRDLLIGSGPELSTEMVMSVEVRDLTSLGQAGQLPPLYWRSFTYDIYTGHGWSSSNTEQRLYQPDQSIQPNQLPAHLLIQQVMRPVAGGDGTIYAAGEPVSVNVSSNAAWRSSNDLFGIQTGGNGYEVKSLIPQVDEERIRKAGQDYPTWITQRYLSLPAEIPTRVKELAIQLTATEPTPYDRARAIEQFLRSYPYSLDVARPLSNQDLVDFFLFDLRKGYCDYYASAMVILARAAGIPARLAIGYASGTYNLNSKRFIVTQADAHSWVEVYFPGTGWVPFEPTAALPVINRSQQSTQGTAPTPIVPRETRGVNLVNPGRYVGFGAMTLLALVGLVWVVYDEIHLRRQKPKLAAAEIYRRIKRYGKLLRVPIVEGETPYEYSASLVARIQDITQRRFSSTVGLNLKVQLIFSRIVRLSYRPSEAGDEPAFQILDQWKSLRWWLRWMWILNIWKSVLDHLGGGLAGITEKPHAQVE